MDQLRAIKVYKQQLGKIKAQVNQMTEYNTQALIELAYAATRVNKGYVKQTRRYSEGQPTTFSNKELIAYTAQQLFDMSLSSERPTVFTPQDFVPLQITDADRESKRVGDKHMRRYSMLALGNLSDFQRDIFSAYSSQKMPIGRIGLIAYLPTFIERELADKIYKQRMKTDFADSEYITENIVEATDVEILKVIPLTNYDFSEPAYLHFGAIGKDLVCFSKKEMYAVGDTYEIVGRIKGQDKERETGLPMTRMNYVKLRKTEM